MNAIEGQLSNTCWTEIVPFSVVVAHSVQRPRICSSTRLKMPVSPAFLQWSKIWRGGRARQALQHETCGMWTG